MREEGNILFKLMELVLTVLVIVSDETVVKVDTTPLDTNTYPYPKINLYGLKRGVAKITVTLNGTITKTVNIIVY